MQALKFEIIGNIQAKQSFRIGQAKTRTGKTFAVKYQPKLILVNSKSIKLQVISQLPKDFVPYSKEVHIERIELCFSPLKSFTKKRLKQLEIWDGEPYDYKVTKPDIDNCLKNLWDSMNGIVFVDDSLICELKNVVKRYSVRPRIVLEITGE